MFKAPVDSLLREGKCVEEYASCVQIRISSHFAEVSGDGSLDLHIGSVPTSVDP